MYKRFTGWARSQPEGESHPNGDTPTSDDDHAVKAAAEAALANLDEPSSQPESESRPNGDSSTANEDNAVLAAAEAAVAANASTPTNPFTTEASYEVHEARAKEILRNHSNLFMIGHEPHIVNTRGSNCSVDR